MLQFIDSILYEALPYGVMGLGIVLTYRYLRLIDLTFSATFAGTPAVAAALMVNGVPFPAALAVGMGFCLLACGMTIFLIRILDLDGLLAGLLTSLAGFSVALNVYAGNPQRDQCRQPPAPLPGF